MGTLEAKADLLNAIIKAAAAAINAGLSEEDLVEVLTLAKDTIEANA